MSGLAILDKLVLHVTWRGYRAPKIVTTRNLFAKPVQLVLDLPKQFLWRANNGEGQRLVSSRIVQSQSVKCGGWEKLARLNIGQIAGVPFTWKQR
jgi:hypothetical protein